MKRLLTALLFFLAAATTFASDYGISAGLRVDPSLTYGSHFDPGMSGGGIRCLFRYTPGAFGADAGLEFNLSPLGTELIFPIGGIWTFAKVSDFDFGAKLRLLPGLALFKPYPLFMIGAEAMACARWNLLPGFGIALEAGVSYKTCPEYNSRVADVSVLNIPILISAEWAW